MSNRRELLQLDILENKNMFYNLSFFLNFRFKHIALTNLCYNPDRLGCPWGGRPDTVDEVVSRASSLRRPTTLI